MQQLFRLLIFLIQPYMFRATNSLILRSTFWLHVQLLVQCTDIAADRRRGWDGTSGWANLSPETCRAELKRLINEKVVCILLAIYIVVLKWCTVTQTAVTLRNVLLKCDTLSQAGRIIREMLPYNLFCSELCLSVTERKFSSLPLYFDI